GPPSDQRPQARKDLVPAVAANSGAPQPAPAKESGTDSSSPANLTERKEPSSSRPEPVSYHAKDVKGLAKFLGKTLDARVYLSRSLKLTRDDPPLVFQGRTLTIEPEEDAVRNKVSPAFALDYDADPGGNWTILKLLAGNVTIRGVRFELNARGAEIQMTGTDWQGGTLLVDNCSFSQEGYANTQRERVAAISKSGRSERGGEPAVNLQ